MMNEEHFYTISLKKISSEFFRCHFFKSCDVPDYITERIETMFCMRLKIW